MSRIVTQASLCLAALAFGCGDVDNPGESDTRGGHSGAGAASGSESGTSSGGSNAGGQSVGAAGGSSAMGGATVGAGGSGDCTGVGNAAGFGVEFEELPTVIIDCQPGGDPDPIGLTLAAYYDNLDNSVVGEATFGETRLVLSDPSTEWTLGLDPPGSGPVEPCTAYDVTHVSMAATWLGGGTRAPCDYCDASAKLKLDMWVDGQASSVVLPALLTCVF